jgi:hypothetical protein
MPISSSSNHHMTPHPERVFDYRGGTDGRMLVYIFEMTICSSLLVLKDMREREEDENAVYWTK